MDSMALAHYRPRPPLDRFVEALWLWDGYVQPHAKERILPDGSMQIVVNLTEDRIPLYDAATGEQRTATRGVLLCGPRTAYSVIDTSSQLAVFGFHFRPGGMLPFLRMPLDELHDREVGLDDLWGRVADELRQRLLEASTPAAKFVAAEQYLVERAVRGFERHRAVAFALGQLCAAPERSITEVCDETGLSSRRFIELFRQQIGVTPKAFARVLRFQRAVRTIGGAGPELDWAGLAAECGYYDQAHFIHDFRGFSGMTPVEYAAARTEHLNHVPLQL